MNKVDTACINTIRILAVEAVEKASSVHPGLHLVPHLLLIPFGLNILHEGYYEVVRIPSLELFEKQFAEYKESVLPASCS